MDLSKDNKHLVFSVIKHKVRHNDKTKMFNFNVLHFNTVDSFSCAPVLLYFWNSDPSFKSVFRLNTKHYRWCKCLSWTDDDLLKSTEELRPGCVFSNCKCTVSFWVKTVHWVKDSTLWMYSHMNEKNSHKLDFLVSYIISLAYFWSVAYKQYNQPIIAIFITAAVKSNVKKEKI